MKLNALPLNCLFGAANNSLLVQEPTCVNKSYALRLTATPRSSHKLRGYHKPDVRVLPLDCLSAINYSATGLPPMAKTPGFC